MSNRAGIIIIAVVAQTWDWFRCFIDSFVPSFWVAMPVLTAVLVAGAVGLRHSILAHRGLSDIGALSIGVVAGSLHVIYLILADLDYWRVCDGEENAA